MDKQSGNKYNIKISNGVRYFFDFKDDHLILRYDNEEYILTEAEIRLLLKALTAMLVRENTCDIEDWLKATLFTSYTVVFDETHKICETKEQVRYGATLGLFIENSQTAYNLHKSR